MTGPLDAWRRRSREQRLRGVVVALFAIALLNAGAWAVWQRGQDSVAPWQIALLLAILPMTELSLLHIRHGHHHMTFTWGEAAVLLALALTSPGWLVLLSLPMVAFAHLVLGRDLLKVVFNAATFSLGAGLAGLVLLALDDPPYRLAEPAGALALGAAVLTWSLFSSLSASAILALAVGRRFRHVLADQMRMLLLISAGNIVVASAILFLAERSRATLIGLPPLILAVYTVYRGYLSAREERDVWQQLEAASRELTRLDRDEVAEATLRRAKALFKTDGAELLVHNTDGTATMYTLGEDDEVVASSATPHSAGPGSATAFTEVRADVRQSATVTCLATPLESPQGRLGWLRLLFTGPVKLTARERRVLTTFAHAVSTTLLNAALYEDVRVEAERKAYEAAHDHLTGLGNRALLAARTEEAVRTGQDIAALLLLDLDHFKEINDTLGHAAGDVLLQEVGRRLEALASEHVVVARLGGDEFAVLLSRLASPRDAEPVADQILRVLSRPVDFEGLRLSVEASLGVACHPQDASTAEELFRRADVAMYQAKSARGQWLRYSADRDDSSVHRQALVAELRAALEFDQIVVHFQPQVDLETGLVIGAEALCRWDHPTRGVLPPGEFVHVAEQSGLVRPFTLRVLDQAVGQCVQWQQEGRPISVAVNLSARSLLDRQLPDDVAAVLRRHDLPPDRLVLEITETTATSELEVVEDVLSQLRQMGVEISVDDFGTGYSSLAFLQRTSVHELKVDQTFVARMLQSDNDFALVRATVQLARSLGARSVAEGVEDAAQAAALRDMGCDVAQGYWLSKPVPASGLRALLALRVAEPGRPLVPAQRPGSEVRWLRSVAGETA